MGRLQRLFKPLGAVLKRMAHGVGARREPALVEGHQEADGAGARVFLLSGGAGAFTLHEAGHVAIEVELRSIDLKIDRVRDSLGKDLAWPPRSRPAAAQGNRPSPLWYGAGRRAPGGGPSPRGWTHVGVGVGIEQLQEETEIDGIALVRSRRQQEKMIRGVAQKFSQTVASRLSRGRRPRHAGALRPQ